jgi:preprotein translocase subunit YajC
MSGSGSGIAQFIPLILIFVIFYFFLIRPQQKRAKDHKAMVATLKRGDEVVTSGGIVGKVERILGEDKLDLLIADNVTVQIVQSTIQSVLNKPNIKK